MNDELKNIFQFTCIKSFIPRPYAEQFKRKFQHNLLITGLSAQQSLTTAWLFSNKTILIEHQSIIRVSFIRAGCRYRNS